MIDLATLGLELDTQPLLRGEKRAFASYDRLMGKMDAVAKKAQEISKLLGKIGLGSAGSKTGGDGASAGFAKIEADALKHAAKMEQIAASSAAKQLAIETKKQSSLLLQQERAAQQNQKFQKQIEAQAQASAKRIEEINTKTYSRLQEMEARRQASLDVGNQRFAQRQAERQQREATRLARSNGPDATLQSAQRQAELFRVQGNPAAAIQLLTKATREHEGSVRQLITAQIQLERLRSAQSWTRYASTIREAGESIQQTGYFLTGLAAGLISVGTAAVQSAFKIDSNVNVLKAFIGSTEGAEARFAALQKLTQATPGLTTGLAAELDAQLRVAGATEAAINRVLPAIGRLNAVKKLDDPSRFSQNLIQLVTQNFEKTDLKELVGQSPIAGQLIKQVFNVDSPTNAQAIRESAQRLGITTVETFLTAFGQAAERNANLANITESLETKFAKIVDRVTVALRPLGTSILDTLGPLVEKAAVFIEKLSAGFQSLPGPVQSAIVVIGLLTTVLGPAVAGIGAMIQAAGALGNLATVATSLQAVTLALQGTAAASTAVGAAATTAGVTTAAAFAPLLPIVLGLAAVIGVVAVAWSRYNAVTERAAKVSVESLTAADRQIKNLQDFKSKLDGMTASQLKFADGQARFQSALSALDPATRTYINSLGDEQTKLTEINRILGEQIKLKQKLQQQDISDIGVANSRNSNELENAKRRLDGLKTLSQEAAKLQRDGGFNVRFEQLATQRVGSTLGGQLSQQLNAGKTAAEALGGAIQDATTKIDAAKNAQIGFGKEVEAYLRLNNLTIDGFVQQQRSLGATQQSIDGNVQSWRAYQEQQRRAAVATNDTASAMDNLGAAARQAGKEVVDAFLNFDLTGIQKSIQNETQKLTRRIVEEGISARKAVEQAQGSVLGRLDDGSDFAVGVLTLGNAVKREQALRKAEEDVRKLLNPTTRTGGGSRSRGTSSDSGVNSLRDSQIKLAEALAAKQLQVERDALETRQRFLDTALDANLISYNNFYAKRAELIRKDAALDISEQQKRIDEQRKKIADVQAKLPGQIAQTKTGGQRDTVNNRAQAEINEANTAIANAERQIAEINSRTTTKLNDNARSVIQKQREIQESVYGVRRAFLELNDQSFMAQIEEDTRRANEEIKKLLVNGQFIAALQAAQNRDVRNRRTQASGIGQQVERIQSDADLVRVKIQNDVTLGVIGEGQARQEVVRLEKDLRTQIENRLKQQLALSKGDEQAIQALEKQLEALRLLGVEENALRERRARIGFLNDRAFVNTAQTQAKDQRLQEQENTAKEIIALQEQIATASEGAADRQRVAYLRAIRDVQQADEDAVLSQIRNRVELADKTVFHAERANARVLDYLNQQTKSVSDIAADAKIGIIEKAFSGVDRTVASLTKNLGEFGDVVRDIISSVAKLALSKLFQRLLGLDGGASNTPSFAPASAGGGGSRGFNPLGAIQNLVSGRAPASAAGGGGASGFPSASPLNALTGGFSGGNPAGAILNPQAAGSSGSPGGLPFGDLLKKIPVLGKLFGSTASKATFANVGGLPVATNLPGNLPLQGPGQAAGTGATGALGSLAGLGASGLLAGGGVLGSLVGGKSATGRLLGGLGGALGLGALGATGIFGSGIAAALPALFSNPFTAIAGGALLGVAFLLSRRAKQQLKSLQRLISGEYGLAVKSDKVLEQVKLIGEGKYGKRFKEKQIETVRLPEVRELLFNYAERTGQKGNSKLYSDAAIQDIDNPANQFPIRRATGGPIPSAGLTPLPGFRQGLVPGADQRRDSVMTALRGGEFVTVPEITRQQGLSRFEALNAGRATILTDSELASLRRVIEATEGRPFFGKLNSRLRQILESRSGRPSEGGSVTAFGRYAKGGLVQSFGSGGMVQKEVPSYAGGGLVTTTAQHSLLNMQATGMVTASTQNQSEEVVELQKQVVGLQKVVLDMQIQLTEAMNRVKGIPKGEMLEAAASENPEAITKAMARSLNAGTNSAEESKKLILRG